MSTQEVPERLTKQLELLYEVGAVDGITGHDRKEEWVKDLSEAILSHMIDKQKVEEARFIELDEILNAFIHDPQRVEALVIKKRNEARGALNIREGRIDGLERFFQEWPPWHNQL